MQAAHLFFHQLQIPALLLWRVIVYQVKFLIHPQVAALAIAVTTVSMVIPLRRLLTSYPLPEPIVKNLIKPLFELTGILDVMQGIFPSYREIHH